MSPEQADGRKLDQRSDLFSLGSVIHFMATGEAPFQSANQLELLKMIREADAPATRKLNLGIPIRLQQAIERLLARDPDHRFQSAAEVEEFFTRYEAYLSSPELNREPRLSSLKKRSTNYFYCVAALVLTLTLTLSVSSLTSWLTQMNISIEVTEPCELEPAQQVKQKIDQGATKELQNLSVP